MRAVALLPIWGALTHAQRSYSSLYPRDAYDDDELDFYTREIDDDLHDIFTRSALWNDDDTFALDARDIDDDWSTLSLRSNQWDDDYMDSGLYARSWLTDLKGKAMG